MKKSRKRKEVEMSDVTFRSPHQELSEAEKDYVRRKMQKLARFFHKIWSIEVVHELVRGQHHIAVHLDADGHGFHIEEKHPEFRAAVDRAVQALEHQLARYKEKLQKGRGRVSREEMLAEVISAPVETASSEEETEGNPSSTPSVRTVKRVSLKPMSLEEALLQAELNDAPFYVFHDADTNFVCVLSRVEAGVYDLIEVTS